MALAAGTRLGPYEVVGLIGAGGMGEVYKARDTRLDRTVAIKVLAADLAADTERRQRFELEAHAASALNHPHICTLFDIGSQDGTDFLVMEYVQGETLARRLSRGALPLHEVLARGVEIADALSTAHQHGIVHRDLKPPNVMLTSHGVKLLDFGLARLTQAPALSGQSDTLTGTGLVVGTVPYMAPEQLEGKRTDARTDVFAFGVVLYEMLTGQRPFKGDSQASIIAAILDREPPPLPAAVPITPPALEHVIRKCLAKDPGARWQSAADVADELRWISDGSGSIVPHPSPSPPGVSAPPLARRSRLAWAAIGVAVLAACAWAGVFAWRYMARGTAGTFDSVAVLPLRNVTGDPAVEYLSDGITDSLINTLSNRAQLRVMASSTMFTYKGRQVDPRQVGRELNVRAVFTGRFSQHGDTVTIDAEVVNADDGSRLWGRQYSGRLDEVIVMQTELARAVSGSLRPTLTSDEQARLARRPTGNAEAYKLYLQGRHHLTKWSEADTRQGIECFRKAIDLDPEYALAYAGLAYAYYGMSNLYLPPNEAMPRVRGAAERALALDDTLPEAHYALAIEKAFYEWDWATADREFRRTMELNPGFTPVDPVYGIMLMVTGKTQAALAEFARVRDLDPLSERIWITSANPYYYAAPADRRLDRAAEECRKLIAHNATFVPAHSFLGAVYEQQGRYADAIEELERARQIEDGAYLLGWRGRAYALAGRTAEARRILREMEVRSARENVAALTVAMVYLGLGDKERTLEWLEKGLERHDEEMTYLNVDPRFDGLKSSPRFTALLQTMHLVP